MQNSKRTNKIGKVFRELKAIYQPQKGDTSTNQETVFKYFREQFQKLGMKINNLNYCQYQLKNGLSYHGIKEATSYLQSNCELVKIPYNLLITWKIAYESELQEMFDDNAHYFFDKSQIEWQKRIMIAFLIYQIQIGTRSKWYHYIRNLPKVIETFSFWSEQEQQLLNDRFLTDQAKRDREHFYQEYEKFKEVISKYQELFDVDQITVQNFSRIYMILQTRIFGNTLPDLTLIPFCDLFNHECVNVYYELNYREQNGLAIKQAIEYRDKQFQEQQQYETDSSTDGSYDSLDLEDEDQFHLDDFKGFLLIQEYDSYQVQFHETFQEKYNQTYNQLPNDNKTISYFGISDSQDYQICPIGAQWTIIKDIYKTLQKFNDQVFTSKLEETIALFIAGQFNFVIDEYISQYMFSQIDSIELMSAINNIINEFTNQRSYLESLQSAFKHQVLECQFNTQRENFQVVEDQETNIKYFVMSTSHKDEFQLNSQVYFCYGRLSNRQLLLRYGFSLEYNKYDHVYIKLNYLAYANCRHTIYLAHQRQVRKTKLITLRQTRFPTEFVQFCKALTFQYKIHNTISIFVFDQYSQEHYAMLLAIDIIENHINKYLDFDEISLEQQLTNPKLNYHQYFSIIYRLEQQRICTQNINLLKMALMMIEDLKGCKKFDINSTKYDQSIPKHFIHPYKYMIAKYFKQCQFVL